MKTFCNQKVYVEGKGIIVTNLNFDKKVVSFGSEVLGKKINLPKDCIVLPGFVDEHIHGAGGADAMDGTFDSLSTISKTLAMEGTTSFLATTMTQSVEDIKVALKNIKDFVERGNNEYSRILGVHLEGPFICKQFKGAQNEVYILKPNVADFDFFNAESGNKIKLVTFAPEQEESFEFVKHLKKCGIVASIGHSNATNAQVVDAIQNGARCITHTYNAQSKLHHRDVGVVGSALLYDQLYCEVICDLIHVSKEALQLLVKNKPKDKVILITDAMRAKGLGDCKSELGGQEVFVKNNEARLSDGTLAGSVLTMNRAIQNMVEKVGVNFVDAVDFATINPAKNLGLDKDIGSIKVGKNADFTVINKNFDVLLTVKDGKIIFDGISK